MKSGTLIKNRVFLAASLLLLIALGSGRARALSFHDFIRMNDDDDATYITAMVEGAAKMLRANGQPDQARKVVAFFKDSSKQGGVNQLAMNMNPMNGLNNRNAINPNNRAHVYEVEDAMALTLKENGIIVPAGYLLAINQNFQPVGPPRPVTPIDSSASHP
jgi:succinyl-CoA synthetase alpha subunit